MYEKNSNNTELNNAIEKMTKNIINIISPINASIYLYGSVCRNDFKLGWSDIDIIVLTDESVTLQQANNLVCLRQSLIEEESSNQYYRSFEGGILSLSSFILGYEDVVVYWGTGGQKITDKYNIDSFCLCELIDNGILLHGKEVREHFTYPTKDELYNNIKLHYETIRKYAKVTKRSYFSYGWLLDISRCIYTLRTGKIISKTLAGEWALREGLCPCVEALSKAVEVRKNPIKYKNDESVFDYAANLGCDIQLFADVLENELNII